jgi:hypothetical protein
VGAVENKEPYVLFLIMKCTSFIHLPLVLCTFFYCVILCEMVGKYLVLLLYHFKRCEVSVAVNAETGLLGYMTQAVKMSTVGTCCMHVAGAYSFETLLPMYLQDAMVSQFNDHDLYHSVYINPFKPSASYICHQL